jgi:hypothetical protein
MIFTSFLVPQIFVVPHFQSKAREIIIEREKEAPLLNCKHAALLRSLNRVDFLFVSQSWLRALSTPLRRAHPSVKDALHANPHNAHHNIHPLALPTLILETPHPIALIVPVRPARAVHATATHALLLRSLLCRRRSSRRRAVHLTAHAPRIAEVLNDGAVDCEFVAAAVGCGF